MELDSREEKLAVRLATLKLEDAERLYDRYERSADSGAVLPTTLDSARTAVELAQVELESAGIAFQDRTIRAVFDGHVGSTDVDPGDRIGPDSLVTTLDDRSALLVSFDIPEQFIGTLSVGDSIELETWSAVPAVTGEIVDIGSRISQANRSFVARARVSNDDDTLRPGMSFRVSAGVTGPRYASIAETALQWGADGAYLWAVVDSVAHRTPVQVIQRRDGRVLVDGEFAAELLIVVEGTQSIREGAVVEVDEDRLAEDAPMSDAQRNDLPSLSVRRPVMVLVLNLLMVLGGLAALLAVEVRELPDVDRPVVSVRVDYPGASPETMDSEVVSLLEGAVARVSGIYRIRSASEENNGRINIEFRPDVDIDTAAADVREAVSRITRRLPERVEQVVVIKADDDAQGVISLAVQSDSLLEENLTRIVEQDIVPMLIAIDGVADVQLSGSRKRVLRIATDPLRLTSFGLSVNDVAAALRQAPFDVPAGSFRSTDQQLIVRADATVVNADQVADIIIRNSVRVGDVASVYFGPEDAQTVSRLNGNPVLGLEVIRQAKSNTMDISSGVAAAVERINERFTELRVITTDDQAVFHSCLGKRGADHARLLDGDRHINDLAVHGHLASDTGTGDRDPGVTDRHHRRHLAVWFLHQHPDAACAGARDRTGRG